MAYGSHPGAFPPDLAPRLFEMVDEGVRPVVAGLKLKISISSVYRLLQQEEKKRGRRAGNRQKQAKTNGWTGGYKTPKTPGTLCLCSSCIKAQPWRADLRKGLQKLRVPEEL